MIAGIDGILTYAAGLKCLSALGAGWIKRNLGLLPDSGIISLKRLSALGAGWIPAFNIASSTGICKLISAGEPFYTYHHKKYKEILPGKLLLSS